jgi:transposase
VGRVPDGGIQPEFQTALAFGDVFALNSLWNALGLRTALQRALRSSRREFDAEALVRAMVFNRLCAPDSKLGCLDWLGTVAIPNVPESVSHDQLLRTMDALMDGADAVQKQLDAVLHPMLDQQLSVVFYDLTTVRVHGDSELKDDVRAFGISKEGGIARQFVLGVVQSSDGLPLMHTVHPGNVSETKTLKGMLESVLTRFPVKRVVVVADRGLLSLQNVDDIIALGQLHARQLEFILAVPARRYGELGEVLDTLTFTDAEPIQESRFKGHRLIVSHDPVRAKAQSQKRRARIDELSIFADRLVNKLDQQDTGVTEKGRRASDRGAYSRFQRALSDAELTRFVKADYQADRFSYEINECAITEAERFDGKLVLLSNVPDDHAEEIVRRYKSLADIERGFRILKQDLEIGPVYHRLPDRIRAHALICFLALVLYRVMQMRLKASGSPHSPKTSLEILRQLQKHRVLIANKPVTGIGKLTPAQLDLFEAMDLKAPK